MSRKWSERVASWPPYSTTRDYRMRVMALRKQSKPSAMIITMEHIDTDQFGRNKKIKLPLPCRPDGPAADFFRACGKSIEVGKAVTPTDCIGRIINVRFRVTDSGVGEPATFSIGSNEHEPEQSDHHNLESTDAQATRLLDR